MERSTDRAVTVAEISSFQLETIEAFPPRNRRAAESHADHLDRHATFEDYAAGENAHVRKSTERDLAVLNADDPEITGRMPAKPHIYWFSRKKRVPKGAFLRDDDIVFRNEGSETVLASATKFLCAANTISKTFWPHAPQLIWRAPRLPPLRAA